jgi:hypothetical protein
MSNNHSEPSVGKRIGELLILSIYLIIDVEEVWPKSHFFALLAAVAGVLALLLLGGGISKKRSAVIMAIAIVASAAIYLIVPPAHAPTVIVSGELLPGSEPIAQNACDRYGEIPADYMVVLIGGGVYTRPAIGKTPLIQRKEEAVLSVNGTADGIMIDANIYNKGGGLVARLKNNEYRVLTNESSYTEQRDLSTIAVFDSEGAELLFVHYENPKTMRIRGIFAYPGKPTVTVTDKSIDFPGIKLDGESCYRNSRTILRLP